MTEADAPGYSVYLLVSSVRAVLELYHDHGSAAFSGADALLIRQAWADLGGLMEPCRRKALDLAARDAVKQPGRAA